MQINHPIRIELPTNYMVGPVNVYLFITPEPILVDAGIKSEEGWQLLQAELATHDLSISDLARVVITHPHVDHIGLAARIVAESDADVWICDLGQPWLIDPITQWQSRVSFYRDYFLPRTGISQETIDFTLQAFEGMAQQTTSIPEARLKSFAVGDQLQMGGCAWQVLHVPGHASMQTCFYQPETKQLLSADMLLAVTPTPIVESPPDGGYERIPALPQFLNSLTLLESLEIETVYPGHGRPFNNPNKVMQRQRTRIKQRTEKCYGLICSGVDTVAALVDIMYSHHPAQYRFAGLWMLVGYLDLLLGNGRISQKTVDGVWHFEAGNGDIVKKEEENS